MYIYTPPARPKSNIHMILHPAQPRLHNRAHLIQSNITYGLQYIALAELEKAGRGFFSLP